MILASADETTVLFLLCSDSPPGANPAKPRRDGSSSPEARDCQALPVITKELVVACTLGHNVTRELGTQNAQWPWPRKGVRRLLVPQRSGASSEPGGRRRAWSFRVTHSPGNLGRTVRQFRYGCCGLVSTTVVPTRKARFSPVFVNRRSTLSELPSPKQGRSTGTPPPCVHQGAAICAVFHPRQTTACWHMGMPCVRNDGGWSVDDG